MEIDIYTRSSEFANLGHNCALVRGEWKHEIYCTLDIVI